MMCTYNDSPLVTRVLGRCQSKIEKPDEFLNDIFVVFEESTEKDDDII